jgi:hypothetical protein
MTILNVVYASAPPNLIYVPTLTLVSGDPDEPPLYLVHGYTDQDASLETGELVKYTACGMTPSLPKEDASGRQSLRFAIDNVAGLARRWIDASLESGNQSYVVYRAYVAPDWSAPQEVIKMTLSSAELSEGVLNAEAAYNDLLNQLWLRDRYDDIFAPGLRHFN